MTELKLVAGDCMQFAASVTRDCRRGCEFRVLALIRCDMALDTQALKYMLGLNDVAVMVLIVFSGEF